MGRRGSGAKYFLPCCCIPDSIQGCMYANYLPPYCCIHVAAFVPTPRVGGEGDLGQNIYYHVAAFLIPFKGVCRQSFCHHAAALTSPQGSGARGSWAKYLLSCCCIPDSILFGMQPGHVLKKGEF